MSRCFARIFMYIMFCFMLTSFGQAFYKFPIEASGGEKPERQDDRWQHQGRDVQVGLENDGVTFFRLNSSSEDIKKGSAKKGYNLYSLTNFTTKMGALAIDPSRPFKFEIKCRLFSRGDVAASHGQGITIYYGAMDDGEAGSYCHALRFISQDGVKKVDFSGGGEFDLDWSGWHTYIIAINPKSPSKASYIILDKNGKEILSRVDVSTGYRKTYCFSDVGFGDGHSLEYETLWDVAFVKAQQGKAIESLDMKQAGDISNEVIKIGNKVQFFIDDYLIKEKKGCVLVNQVAQKYPGNPVLKPDKPWERNRVSLFGSVIKEDGLFKMWYYVGSVEQSREKGYDIPFADNSFLCYATSKDGVHWEKPELGIVEFNGSKKNNIVLRHHGSHLDSCCVLKADWETDSAKKYKLTAYSGTWPYKGGYKKLGYKYPPGHYLYYSPDGIHWKMAMERPILYLDASDRADKKNEIWGFDASVFCVDNIRKKYVGFIKRNYLGKRSRYYTESEDAIHWSNPVLCLHADSKDPKPETQMYYNSGFPYESMWLGINVLYYPRTTEAMIPELVYSRDGKKWFRPHKREQHIIPLGPKGSWDYAMISIPTTPPVMVGEKMYFYYGGYAVRHDRKNAKDVKQWGAIGLATLPRDRFVAMKSASNIPAELVTKVLETAGRQLNVNCDVKGYLKVEVLDCNGKVLPGYSIKECKPVTGNKISDNVSWQKVDKLPSGKIMLRFVFENCELFAFEVK